ncbi:MAG TPA: P-loop NTPase fold protein, partial [Longimicrobium sp.]
MPGGLEVALLPRDPVTIFESEDPDTLLAQIAAEIRMGVDRRLAEMEARQESGDAWGAPSAFAGSESSGAPDPLRELLSHYKVSYSVGAVLVHAAEYAAAASPPAVLSTSLVLLTLAEHGARKAAPMWVGDWLRTRLGDAFDEMRGGYFDEKRIPGEARTDGRVERLRAGVALTLDRARGLALRTTPTAEIRGRHLLAAMLTDERPNAGALKQLRRAGLNQSGLRADLYDFVRAYGDDDEAWGDILLGPVAADARLSGFHADDSRSVDYLDVRPDVEAFGKLIAARTVEPPLSIGLFGEWGSGKTFFMRMLQGEVNRLAQLADSSGRMQCDLPYWKRIIQIEFNAWHYVEENLWASLANRLFEALHNTDPRSASWSFRQQLERQRDHERSLADRAEEEKHAAEVETTNAEAEFLAAQRQFARLSATATTASGKSLLAAVDAAAVRRAVAGPLQQLGLLRLEGSAADLIGELDRAGNELGRVRGVLAPLFRGPRRERLHRAALLAAAVLGAPAVGFVLYAIIDRVGPEGWARVAGLAGGAAGILGTGKAWIRKQLAVVRLWRTEVESAKRRVDSVLVEEYDRLREAESRRGKLQVAAEAARQGLEEARDRLAKAEARLRSASLAEELTRFVSERFGSGDYRSQLSTLARVREDFERLSELIEEENWRLTPTLQGEDTSRRGLRKFETLEEEAGDRGARVNRIVLYIDDLDRCPPAKVVEVLQAV